jgi:hypothetical protein
MGIALTQSARVHKPQSSRPRDVHASVGNAPVEHRIREDAEDNWSVGRCLVALFGFCALVWTGVYLIVMSL